MLARTVAALAACGTALSASAQLRQVETTRTAPATQAAALGDVVTGRAALERLGDQLASKASEFGVSEGQLAATIMRDRSLYVRDDLAMMYACDRAPANLDAPNARIVVDDEGNQFAGRGGDIPLDDFLSLSSRPSATRVIYLDFDGHFSTGNSWGHSINFPAYNTQGSTASFTDQEKADIIAHWQEVVEDFAPFNVNVTTQDPGTAALRRTSSGDVNYGMRVVMTQVVPGFVNAGGVALLNTFASSTDTPCFAFNKGLGAGPMTVSHEVGHTFGLFHDGLSGSEYHPGSSGGGASSWGPIMGAPFGRNIVQWSNGDYPGRTTTQNDIAIMGNSLNGVTALPDDITNDLFPGQPAELDVQYSGVISSGSDIDVFGISLEEATDIRVVAESAPVGENVDVKVEVWRFAPSFGLIATIDPTNTPDVDEVVSLDAGDYSFAVEGSFQSLNNGPVSNYGSIGTYTLRLEEQLPPEPITVSFPDGVPSTLAEGVPTEITIQIDPGTNTVDLSRSSMNFGIDGPAIGVAPLVPAGGD
ncbi:MAG: reprolysin-like metallopeptidase, partial [Planctomycetota bacterium]